jgi:hypothetical protein
MNTLELMLELHLFASQSAAKSQHKKKLFSVDEKLEMYFKKVMSSPNTQLRVLFINKILLFISFRAKSMKFYDFCSP